MLNIQIEKIIEGRFKVKILVDQDTTSQVVMEREVETRDNLEITEKLTSIIKCNPECLMYINQD